MPSEAGSSIHEERKPNHLINEKSPYLLQHAYNPVDWYPWSDAAFRKAIDEDKPIFLSIGYSACHWCHVMEGESFDDEEVAAILNEYFISIKVDREERPDIDSVYMTVAQLLTGSGGWPLTIFMTPDKKPFFAGTYLPKSPKYDRPGIIQVLGQVAAFWRDDRAKLLESGDAVAESLQQLSDYKPGDGLKVDDLRRAYAEFLQRFDGVYGGFSVSPKFPSPHNLSFLLRWWKRSGNEEALVMVERTLQMMSRGGIRDLLGGGFHRYSTDPVWLVPHFEKMLYDQAMLAIAYIEAYQATGNELYADVAGDIFTYVLRDITSPEGGFYSAEDADSEGVEGKFYVWTVDEIRSVLDKRTADLFIKFYGVTERGNFEGANIPYTANVLDKFAGEEGVSEDELKNILDEARQKLFLEREKRVHPFKDDKILTDWNGLMIAALAKGLQALGKPEYADAAKKAADFILSNMRRDDGRLLHRYRDGEAGHPAYVDDYAFLTWGLIELYEATFDVKYLREAVDLTNQMLELFRDDANGGLYFTGSDAEELIARTKEIYDGAIPSGNSVAALNLLRLGRMTANQDYERRAEDIVKTFGDVVTKSPTGFAQFLTGFDFLIGPSEEIVIAGELDDEPAQQMLRAIRERFIPNKVLMLHPDGEEGKAIEELVPFVRDMAKINGKATAYVCENYACKAPTNDIDELIANLE